MSTNYGRDVGCTTSLRTGRLVSGTRLVAEAAYRRLTTPRGLLRGGEEEADYGIDLCDIIGTSNPKRLARTLPSKIRAELTKDERIIEVVTNVTVVVDGPATRFVLVIEATTDTGPFTLTLAASDVTVELLGIETEEP